MQGERRGPAWVVVVLVGWGLLSALGVVLVVIDGGAGSRETVLGACVSAGALAAAAYVGGRA